MISWLVAALLVSATGASSADTLSIEQIGDSHVSTVQQSGGSNRAMLAQGAAGMRGNRAMLHQGSLPGAAEVEATLRLDATATLFDVVDADTLADGEGSPTPRTLAGLLSDFAGTSGGSNNSAALVQHGSDNRTLAVQVGSGNRLVTEQFGDGNIGVHLQRGSGNDTELIQRNGGNVNALIARGGVNGNDGGPLTLEAQGDVAGFSLAASGPQSFARATVGLNATGGLTINLQQR
ncbi:MAG: hypothetical protein ACQER5_10720 [Pseudomonadota bacterium]